MRVRMLMASAGAILSLGACSGARPELQEEVVATETPQVTIGIGTELESLVVEEPHGGGYKRTEHFGSAWVLDEDHNGCRQRDDVLARDFTAVTISGRCTVTTGVLIDPYTGKVVEFVKSKANDIQVDHVYPLGLAWRHGAAVWTYNRRVQFANDLDNLLATTALANQRKSDKGPSLWMPRVEYWCEYAERYIKVAYDYGLSISKGDKQVLVKAIGMCGDQAPTDQ